MLSEFDLIRDYFVTPTSADARIALGIGDDCALLAPTPGLQLALSTDMLVAGRHFFADADARLLGHKCLAVNLSDLAAMGARPLAFTLALALPQANPAWLKGFSGGLLALAQEYGCTLIGGDTTKGPLTVSITVFGEVAPGRALRRDAAQPGDQIWISGTLGEARLALAHALQELTLTPQQLALAAPRLHMPTPRIALGLALQGIAHAALDISDGLSGDLGHILQRSGVGARLDVDALPAGAMLALQPQHIRRNFMLSGGDDYELCFTAAPTQHAAVLAAGRASHTQVTCVGRIEAAPGLRLHDASGQVLALDLTSFDHFRSP